MTTTVYLYLGGMILLSIIGIYVQYKYFYKSDEEEKNEDDKKQKLNDSGEAKKAD